MPSGVEEVAAATAVVGYDLLKDAYFNQLGNHRAIDGFALKGSAAAGDTEIELFVDEVKIGIYKNTGTGYPNDDDVVPLEQLGVPAYSRVHAYVTDAPATNPVYVRLDTRS